MPLYNVESIIIRSRNAGEADKIITVFSRNYGKISVIAKGAKRPTSKFGGRLEVFTYNQMLLATAKTFDILSQCETIESFFKIREDKDKLNAGAYILRLIDASTEERQRNDQLFDLLLESLHYLEKGKDMNRLMRAFEVKFCLVEGFLPTDEILEKKYIRLPLVIDRLRGNYEEGNRELNEKDLAVSGKILKELISDHIGKDVRRFRSVL